MKVKNLNGLECDIEILKTLKETEKAVYAEVKRFIPKDRYNPEETKTLTFWIPKACIANAKWIFEKFHEEE